MSSAASRVLTFQTLIRVRTLCLVIIMALLWVSEDNRSAQLITIAWELLFISIALSLVFGALGKMEKLVSILLPVVFLLDGFFICLWIGISGGPVSYYVPLFLLVLVHALLTLKPRLAVPMLLVLMTFFLGFFYIDYYWGLSKTFHAADINRVYALLENATPEVRQAVYWHQSLRWTFFCILIIVVVSMAMRQVWWREEQLRDKERALEQKRHLVQMGEMTGRIAHGVNTPLGLISGNLELLMASTRKGTKTHKGLEQINQYVQRAIRTVRDILDYGRQSMSQIKPVSFPKIAQAVAQAVQPKLKKVNGNLILDVDPDLPEMMGYPDGLFQAMLNLVENAIDSIANGGVVALSAKFEYRMMRLSAHDERGHIRVLLRDNGKGIPEDKLAKIFEPFYSTKDFGKGTGLGLAIVKRIVDEHGGTIEVESHVDSGTTFTLIFPVEDIRPEKGTDSEDLYYNKSEAIPKDVDL